MTFVIDSDLIKNNKIEITENSDSNLELIHLPSGAKLEIDESATISQLNKANWQ